MKLKFNESWFDYIVWDGTNDTDVLEFCGGQGHSINLVKGWKLEIKGTLISLNTAIIKIEEGKFIFGSKDVVEVASSDMTLTSLLNKNNIDNEPITERKVLIKGEINVSFVSLILTGARIYKYSFEHQDDNIILEIFI